MRTLRCSCRLIGGCLSEGGVSPEGCTLSTRLLKHYLSATSFADGRKYTKLSWEYKDSIFFLNPFRLENYTKEIGKTET